MDITQLNDNYKWKIVNGKMVLTNKDEDHLNDEENKAVMRVIQKPKEKICLCSDCTKRRCQIKLRYMQLDTETRVTYCPEYRPPTATEL